MSLKYTVVLMWVICLSFKVVLTGCEVSLVNRNVIDSFRVGEDSCTNDGTVCTDFRAVCRQSDGLCLCTGNEPNFRKPTSKDYGCLSSESIHTGFGGNLNCEFRPFQLIPYSHQDPATSFSDTNAALTSCILTKALAKFPNNPKYIDQPWLNESYVDLRVSTDKLNFKWKKSVPSLQGTIITLSLFCTLGSSSFTTKCLRAKILGTWPTDGNTEHLTTVATSEPTTVPATQSSPTQSSPTSDDTSNNSMATSAITSARTSPSSEVSSSDDDSSGTIIQIIIAVVGSVVLLTVMVVLLWCLYKREKRDRS